MKDAGPKKVLGYFGPAWLINYVMAGNSGEKNSRVKAHTETGLYASPGRLLLGRHMGFGQ